MLESETLVVLGRLGLATFVAVAPTLLFLGLCRALEGLRNDAFVTEWTESNDTNFDPADMNDVLGVLSKGIGRRKASGAAGQCSACGSGNSSDGRFCADCLGRLPRDR